MQRFRLSAAHQISPNLYFDRLLLLKICKISAKIVQRSYVSWHWRVMQNLKKQWFVVLKMTRIRWFLTGALKSLKNLHFDWSLSCKVHDFWAKNSSKELSFMIQESDAKFEEKLTCGVENDKEFGKFSPGHSKASKLRIWWDPFIQSRTCMSLKFTGELSFSWQWRIMQNLERNWLISSKSAWEIWQVLTWALKNLRNLLFNGLL